MPEKPLPDFGNWSNEEIGAFFKGLAYLENGGDVQEIIDNDLKRSLLAAVEQDDSGSSSEGGVATVGQLPTREQYIDRIAKAADKRFRKAFGDKAVAVASQISTDVHPFLAEAYERIAEDSISYDDLNQLLSKMVIVAAASTVVAAQKVGFK